MTGQTRDEEETSVNKNDGGSQEYLWEKMDNNGRFVHEHDYRHLSSLA